MKLSDSGSGRSHTLLRICLQILQTLVLLQEQCAAQCSFCWLKFGTLLLALLPGAWTQFQEVAAQKQGKKAAIPRSVGIVLADPVVASNAQLQLLKSTIIWCAEGGLHYIAVYDETGAIKTSLVELESLLKETNYFSFTIKNGIGGTGDKGRSAPSHITADSSTQLKRRGAGQESSKLHQSKQTVEVLLLDSSDSVNPLLIAARLTSNATADVPGTTLEPDELCRQLSTAVGPSAVREAELLLVFGPVLMLVGYPPWLIRTSEIYGLGSLQETTRAEITAVLHQYCKTTQRFGS